MREILFVYFIAFVILDGVGLLVIGITTTRDLDDYIAKNSTLFLPETQDQNDIKLLELSFIFGSLGASIYGLKILIVSTSEGKIDKSHLPWFIARPFIGATLAVVTNLLLYMILLTATNGTRINEYSIAALSSLVGLLATDFSKKLRTLFERLFGLDNLYQKETDISDKSEKKVERIDMDNWEFENRKFKSLEKDNLTKKCGAIIVGINECQNNNIPKLLGAENDANEIYQQLKDRSWGNFKILDNHLLVGKDATSINIRGALNKIFSKANDFDLILFYFSGNMYVDRQGVTCLVPYDIISNNNGINMSEIGYLISHSPHQTRVIMVFDTCYNDSNEKIVKDTIFYSEKQFEQDIYYLNRGRVSLYSSQVTSKLKEDLYIHKNNDKPHHHGVLSYYFIKGLEKSNEIINVTEIIEYVKHEMLYERLKPPIIRGRKNFVI